MEATKRSTSLEMVDRFTELPESIIHHILSFLPPGDATRTSILSTRFRSLWYSFPCICFDESIQTGKDHQEEMIHKRIDIFLRYVHDSLRRRPTQISLQRFSFHVTLQSIVFHGKSDDRIDSVIAYALENHVKELVLDVAGSHFRSRYYYLLPSAVFSARSIASLKLKGFMLAPHGQDFILTNSSIEDLSLERCIGMKSLRLSCYELKILNIKSCERLRKIEMVAPKIESLSFNGMTITELRSFQLNFSPCTSISLKHLTLQNSQIRDACLAFAVSRLLMLQTLKLRHCSLLHNLSLSGCPELKIIELENCAGLQKIEVIAPKLQSFVFNNWPFTTCTIIIDACKLLKKIALSRVQLINQWLVSTISSELALLEEVKLLGCIILGDFKIFHEKLKIFELLQCQLEKAEIDARNLTSFVCCLESQPLSLAIHSPQATVKILLEYKHAIVSVAWFLKLRDVLASMGHCRQLELICNSEKLLMIPESLRENLLSPMYDLKRLKVEISKKIEQPLVDLIDSLLWLAPHPNFISILSGSTEKTLKLEYYVPDEDEDDAFCCMSWPVKCWRHHLKQVTMENLEASENNSVKQFITRNAMRLEAVYDC